MVLWTWCLCIRESERSNGSEERREACHVPCHLVNMGSDRIQLCFFLIASKILKYRSRHWKLREEWQKFRKKYPRYHYRDIEAHFNCSIQIYAEDRYSLIHERTNRKGELSFVLRCQKNSLLHVKNPETSLLPRLCSECNRLFTSLSGYYHHKRRCSPFATREVYASGGYGNFIGRDLMTRLSTMGIQIPISLIRLLPIATYDWEAKFRPASESGTEKQIHLQNLEPLSYAIDCSLPGFSPIFRAHDVPTRLCEMFFRDLERISNLCYRRSRLYFASVFRSLGKIARECATLLEEGERNGCSWEYGRRLKSRLDAIRVLRGDLVHFLRALPVLGYYSRRFDLPLILPSLATYLKAQSDSSSSRSLVIKKGGSLSAVLCPRIRLLDVTTFIASSYGLESFLQQYLGKSTKRRKGFLPYEMMRSVAELKSMTSFPPISAFYSTLHGATISESEYATACQAWDSLPAPRTMYDYLRYYNLLDVSPLTSAAWALRGSWLDNYGVDIFRSFVSLPAASYCIAARNLNPFSYIFLPSKSHAHVNRLIDESIYGGLSIVFTRYAQVGGTRIREREFGDSALLVRGLRSYDSNSLYMYSYAACPNPCSDYVVYTSSGHGMERSWRARSMTRYWKSEVQWLAWEEKEGRLSGACNNHRILNRFSGAASLYLGSSIKPDGYCLSCRTVYEFLGPSFHGKCPKCPERDFSCPEDQLENAVKWAETEKRSRFIRDIWKLKLVTICECEWKRMKRRRDVKLFLKGHFPRHPLHRGFASTRDMLAAVQNGSLFALFKLNIQVRDSAISKWSRFPPFIRHREITREMMPECQVDLMRSLGMSEKPRRYLISSLEAKDLYVTSSLLKFFLDTGEMEVTNVEECIAFVPKYAFRDLGQKIISSRIAASRDPSHSLEAQTFKTMGNSIFGKFIENKKKHKEVYYSDYFGAKKCLGKPNFHFLEELSPDTFEVSMLKRKVLLDTPKIVASFLLNEAKHLMCLFFDTLSRCIDPRDFDTILSDTDSLCISTSNEGSLDEIVRPEMRELWERMRPRLFPLDSSLEEQKKLGAFKIEFDGSSIVALSSKTYYFEPRNEPRNGQNLWKRD